MIASEGPTFSIRAQARGGDVVVAVTGDVDLGSAPAFREALANAVEHADATVVVDLGGVDYLDSTGVHSLYDAVAATREAGKAIRVERATPHVARVLGITGLDALIAVAAEN